MKTKKKTVPVNKLYFDKETTRKLTKVFYKKVEEIEACSRNHWREDFANLMRGLGIDQINCGEYHTMSPCQEETIIGDCDRLQGCVLVFDPSCASALTGDRAVLRSRDVGNRYLLIPKELAEKILILGCPCLKITEANECPT